MNLTRRDFIKATSAIAAAFGLSGALRPEYASALEAADGGLPVVWLQAQTCTGCSVSLLNSMHYATIEGLLTGTLDLDFHPNLVAAAGEQAVAAAEASYAQGGYVLVLEGAIPTADGGAYCTLWPGTTALSGVNRFARKASFIMGVGTCACFGGVSAGSPNPTGARGLGAKFANKRVINIPGCPAHPDWVVGTIAYLLANGQAPPLDRYGRPTEFFGQILHSICPLRGTQQVEGLSLQGCLRELGCNGPQTHCDCSIRKWNATAAGGYGVNWCIGAGSPCYGCTEPSFPDGMSPFYELGD